MEPPRLRDGSGLGGLLNQCEMLKLSDTCYNYHLLLAAWTTGLCNFKVTCIVEWGSMLLLGAHACISMCFSLFYINVFSMPTTFKMI